MTRPVDVRCPNDRGGGLHVRAALELPVDALAEGRWRALNAALGTCSCGAPTAVHVRRARHCRFCKSAEHTAPHCPQNPRSARRVA